MIQRPTSGIPQYESTDIIGSDETVDDTLNILADATHDSIESDRGRISSLESRMNAADIQAISVSAWCSLASGWTWTDGKPAVIRRIGSRIEYTVFLTKDSNIAHGNSALTISSDFSPIKDSEWYGSGVFSTSSGGTTTTAGVCLVSTARNLLAMSPPSDRTRMYMSGFYHRV